MAPQRLTALLTAMEQAAATATEMNHDFLPDSLRAAFYSVEGTYWKSDTAIKVVFVGRAHRADTSFFARSAAAVCAEVPFRCEVSYWTDRLRIPLVFRGRPVDVGTREVAYFVDNAAKQRGFIWNPCSP